MHHSPRLLLFSFTGTRSMARPAFLFTLLFILVGNTWSGQFARTKPEKFTLDKTGATIDFCYNWSCTDIMDVRLETKLLKTVTKKINRCATSAEQELLAIRNAVRDIENQILADHEVLTGDIAGNEYDLYQKGKLDCVDNSSNTNVMLHALQKYKKFKYWTVDKPVGDGFFRPHWTATLKTKDKDFLEKYRDSTKIGDKDYTIWTMDTWLTTFTYKPFMLEINDWIDNLDPWGNKIYRELYHEKIDCWGQVEDRSREDVPPKKKPSRI